MISGRGAFGGQAGEESADGVVGRGLADLLAALDNAIDDDVALGRICARLGSNVADPAGGREAVTACGGSGARTGVPGSAITTVPASGPAASRRRPALLSAAASAALTAAAVAVAAIVVPGAGRGGTQESVVETAYVVKHLDSALDAASAGAIAQMTVTTRSAAIPGGTTSATAREWSYGDQWRAVTYSAAGHLIYDEGFSTASVYTVVSYQTRTWARQRQAGHPAALSPGPRGCAPVVATLPLLFQPGLPGAGVSAGSLTATAVRALRAAVSCGALAAAAGRQRVDGIDALVLTSSPASPIPETIWVSQGTYLPVRVTVRPVPGTPGQWQTADITWLQPTKQNLAHLTVPIPAGFRQVPIAWADRPLMRHISAGQPPASG
jgi:hypothetical protein